MDEDEGVTGGGSGRPKVGVVDLPVRELEDGHRVGPCFFCLAVTAVGAVMVG